MSSLQRHTARLLGPAGLVLLPIALGAPLAAGHAKGDHDDPCTAVVKEALNACRKQAAADFFLQRGKCANLPSFDERLECYLDAMQEYKEEVETCLEQRAARLEVCDELGGGVYAPEVDPAGFVALIDNPYMPLLPGTTRVYEKDGEDGLEHTEVSVLEETKEILGVECTVVRDVVWLDGVLIEDTLDWFAQDLDGNVWYFGEIAKEYEDGELTSLGGSWKAGVDGALPGIVMPAVPQVGALYRQEYLLGEAEDVAAVWTLSETVLVPYGTFTQCVGTEDYTPLEPDVLENKFYAAGVGVVLEVDLETGERTELIDVLMD